MVEPKALSLASRAIKFQSSRSAHFRERWGLSLVKEFDGVYRYSLRESRS